MLDEYADEYADGDEYADPLAYAGPRDVPRLADAVEALSVSVEPWAAEVVRVISTPAVVRHLRTRRTWAEAERIFHALRADGLSTREAAKQTRPRLHALGLHAPSANVIRQTLLRRGVEARAAGRATSRCANTSDDPTLEQ